MYNQTTMAPLPAAAKDTLFWVCAVLAAVVLALAGPSERQVMGVVPPVATQDLNHRPVALPGALPAERTLALIAFERSHSSAVESWITGLRLRDDARIAWLRMPVLNDPGTVAGRDAVESRLQHRFPDTGDRARLVPVFTDRAAFVRAAGLGSTEQMYAVVLGRGGEVLARAEGWFDENKAAALRATLHAEPLYAFLDP